MKTANKIRDYLKNELDKRNDSAFYEIDETGNTDFVIEVMEAYAEAVIAERMPSDEKMKITLRDKIAMAAMQSEIISWNKEMSPAYRVKIIEDMIKRFGQVTVNDAIALMSYEIADAMCCNRIKGQ